MVQIKNDSILVVIQISAISKQSFCSSTVCHDATCYVKVFRVNESYQDNQKLLPRDVTAMCEPPWWRFTLSKCLLVFVVLGSTALKYKNCFFFAQNSRYNLIIKQNEKDPLKNAQVHQNVSQKQTACQHCKHKPQPSIMD